MKQANGSLAGGDSGEQTGGNDLGVPDDMEGDVYLCEANHQDNYPDNSLVHYHDRYES